MKLFAATFVIHLWISNWRKKITHPIEIAMHACEVMWPPSYSALFLHSEQTQDRHNLLVYLTLHVKCSCIPSRFTNLFPRRVRMLATVPDDALTHGHK